MVIKERLMEFKTGMQAFTNVGRNLSGQKVFVKKWINYSNIHQTYQCPKTVNMTNAQWLSDTDAELYKNGLKILFWNVRSLNVFKFEALCRVLASDPVDVVFICETFFTPETPSALFEIPGYNLLRRDRMHKSGGGLLCWFSKELVGERLVSVEPTESETEIMCISLCPSNSKRYFTIFCVYRPDDTGVFDHGIQECISRYQRIHPLCECIVVG